MSIIHHLHIILRVCHRKLMDRFDLERAKHLRLTRTNTDQVKQKQHTCKKMCATYLREIYLSTYITFSSSPWFFFKSN